ncbi:MAG: hypothetical protein K8R56_02175 [Candidatus Eisenbacteria bacterium]|nr:hypothetical protein [Candidatus Eisenbacteria bacterium]
MKLLSDFDGVWTFPAAEGTAHGAALDAALLALLPTETDAARDWIGAARWAVRQEPMRWGWSVAGRLSAFGDEDPFTEHGAVLHYLALQAERDPLAARLVAAIEAKGQSIEGFGGDAHVAGVKQVESTRGPGITEAAADAGRRMLAGGIEIVVVSNSGTEKLQRWFEHARVPAVVHPTQVDGQLRLRGSAKKFVLGPSPGKQIMVGDLSIDVARPFYTQVLDEEAPDAVVGDVLSLDLSLPLHLKRTQVAWKHVRLFWLMHPYTPERMKREVAKLAPGEVEMVEGGLAGVAERLLAR